MTKKILHNEVRLRGTESRVKTKIFESKHTLITRASERDNEEDRHVSYFDSKHHDDDDRQNTRTHVEATAAHISLTSDMWHSWPRVP